MAMVFDKWQELNELISKDIDPKPITPNKPKKKNVKKKTNSALSVWRGRILKNGVITASPNATTT